MPGVNGGLKEAVRAAMILDDTQARIMGSLIEKSLATPDYYPLTLNALTNACNQKSNRDPVVDYNDQAVADALDELEVQGLVWKSRVGRVPKYEERFTRKNDLVAREASILCVLLLRGPQTAGELRGRTARMHAFEGLADVADTLNTLVEWEYVQQLPRMPGHKESRYAHRLSGDLEAPVEEKPVAVREKAPCEVSDRLEKLARDVTMLRDELATLKDAFDGFKKQFD